MNSKPTPSVLEKRDLGLQNSQVDMVAFRLDRQIYTLPIEMIYQIIDMVAITPIPEGNDAIEGIFNYHGTTVPVVDLRRYLNLSKIPIHLHTPIILISFYGQIIGLIVDKVIDVISCPRQAILPPGDLLPVNFGEIPILDGLIQSSEDFLMLLNLEHLFSGQRQKNLVEALVHFSAQPGEAASYSPNLMDSAQEKPAGMNRDSEREAQTKGNLKERQKASLKSPSRQAPRHEKLLITTQEERA